MEGGGEGRDSKGKEEASDSGSEAEGEEEEGKKEEGKARKKMEARRAKLFKESTAMLRDVRSMEMLAKFRPLPNQQVMVQVPEDVDVVEFVRISRYADQQGYSIADETHMMRLMLQRVQNMRVLKEDDDGEDHHHRPGRPDAGGARRNAHEGDNDGDDIDGDGNDDACSSIGAAPVNST